MRIERDEGLCKYNGGSCPNKRAVRSRARRQLRLCEYHQHRANTYQKKYLQRHNNRQRPPPAIEGEPVASPVSPAAAAAPVLVFIFARETNMAASLLRLASAHERVRTGRPLSAVACESSEQLIDLLHRSGGREAVTAAVGWQSALTMSTTTARAREQPKATHSNGLDSFLVEPSIDTESLPSPDDADWLSDLLE
jgi:hypothetical protein